MTRPSSFFRVAAMASRVLRVFQHSFEAEASYVAGFPVPLPLPPGPPVRLCASVFTAASSDIRQKIGLAPWLVRKRISLVIATIRTVHLEPSHIYIRFLAANLLWRAATNTA